MLGGRVLALECDSKLTHLFFIFGLINKSLPKALVMFVVHLFSLLLEPSLWRLITGSPTDDNSLRSGHGEQGEPGHNEHHKDSYSTFASEFLESRYLSDEGSELGYC